MPNTNPVVPLTATASLNFQHPFVVDFQHVKKLVEILRERIGDVELKAACADDIERQFPDAKRLIAYENVKSRAIRELRISAWSGDSSKRAVLHFSDNEYNPVSVDLSGTELVVQRLRDDIMTVIEGTRPWYARLARLDLFTAVFPAISVLMVVLISAVGFGWLAVSEAETTQASRALSTAFLYLILSAIIAVAYIMERFRKRLFPIATFAIGRAKGRHEFLEKIRWGVGIAFLVSLLAGLPFAIIFR